MQNRKWTLGAAVTIAIVGSNVAAPSAQVVRDWVASYPGLRAVAVVADASGGIYVAGTSLQDAAHNFNNDIVVLKYSLTGALIWAREFDEQDDATFGTDFASHMALDPQGNVIVTGGSFLNTSGDDFITLKYDPDGNLIWKTRYTPASEGAVRLGIDASGGIYITGPSSRTPSGRNYVTVKYDPNGVQQWVRTYNGPNSFDDNPKSIAVSAGGLVAVTGESTGGVTSFDFATILYDTNGNELWVRRYNNPSDTGDYGFDVALGPAGEVYVVGLSAADATLVKYDASGNQQWVRAYNGPANLSDLFQRVRVDSNGDVIAAGYVQSPSFYTDLLVAKYDSEGTLLWDDIYVGPIESDDWATAIALDANDAIYLTGASDTGLLTARYDPNGERVWLDVYVAGPFANRGYSVAIDMKGNVVSAGQSPILTAHYDQSQAFTAVEEVGAPARPLAALDPPSPNPAGRSSTIVFRLAGDADARLRVYNVAGEIVATLADGRMTAGAHEIAFAPKGLPSGLYVVALETSGERLTRRLHWIR
jgi:PQQ-like domain